MAPRYIHKILWKVNLRVKSLFARNRCSVCKRNVTTFYEYPSPLMNSWIQYGFPFQEVDFETVNIHQYECPFCGAPDRYRLYALYFSGMAGTILPGERWLEFAPHPSFDRFMKSLKNIQRVTADLVRTDVDIQLDITSMSAVESESYHAILCSHVLEHVKDDARAFQEMYRILKPGGWALLMVPIDLRLKETVEESGHLTEADRWRLFGQDDHVRMYSKSGFQEMIRHAGFILETYGKEHFGEEELARHGVSPTSVLYIGRKKHA